jgi:hypothetical protein
VDNPSLPLSDMASRVLDDGSLIAICPQSSADAALSAHAKSLMAYIQILAGDSAEAIGWFDDEAALQSYVQAKDYEDPGHQKVAMVSGPRLRGE